MTMKFHLISYIFPLKYLNIQICFFFLNNHEHVGIRFEQTIYIT